MQMNRDIVRILIFTLVAFALSSCLFENDIAYPRLPADIVSIELEGQKSVKIDSESRHIDVVLSEEVDMSKVGIKGITISETASFDGDSIPKYLDLSQRDTIHLKTYYDVLWTIDATQPIDRYVKVENQIGDPIINVDERTVLVYISSSQHLRSVIFNDVKLEPVGATLTSIVGMVSTDSGPEEEIILNPTFPLDLECIMLRKFVYTYKGEKIEWIVRVMQKNVSVEVTSVNAWARKADVKALFDGTGAPVLEYRVGGDGSWTAVQDAVIAGSGVSAQITGLEPSTSYQVRLVNGDMSSKVVDFQTEEAAQIPNLKFDTWWCDGDPAGKGIWYPYSQGDSAPVWDSANPGAATFIGSSTSPEENFVKSGKAARMESKYAVIAFAAGNIYTGKFGKIAGVGAELDWGYPFTSRPTALKGWYSYSPKVINRTKEPYTSLAGEMDKCKVQIILTDWDGQFRINTTTGTFVDIENDPNIIAFAEFTSDRATEGYEEFRLELKYRDKTRKPKYIVIAACASALGDYFTGGEGSVMYVDEFELEY